LIGTRKGNVHIQLSRNPFVNQVSFFPGDGTWTSVHDLACRNPFVNQVSFFNKEEEKMKLKRHWSQSLRKSGQFLCSMKQSKSRKSCLSQSLRKSGQFLFKTHQRKNSNIVKGRNPFVNQVSFFLISSLSWSRAHRHPSQSLRKSGQFLSSFCGKPRGPRQPSQSLRKSGQFLSAKNPPKQPLSPSRNPFVNQVSFFHEPLSPGAHSEGRNPFVNQVSFFQQRMMSAHTTS